MVAEELKTAIAAQPFRPFSLRLADGRSVSVPHREFISVEPRGRTALVWKEAGGHNLVDVTLVTDFEFPANTEPPRDGNGASKH
jgi:hypothetical protein